MKRLRKLINLILVLTIVFSLVGTDFAIAIENNEENQSESQEQPIIGLEHSVEKYYKIDNSSESEESEEDSLDTAVLQERIQVQRNENIPKIENENLSVILPVLQEQNPSNLVVLANGVKLEENSYSYDAQNGILKITLDEEKELKYIGNSVDTYQIICKYTNIEFEPNININLNTTVYTKCENIDEVTLQKEDNVDVTELGSSLSFDGKISEEIYKGYLYQGNQRDTDFVERYQISISDIEEINEITIDLQSENYVQENEENKTLYDVNGNTYYKGIYLTKEDMLRILGQDGNITISDLNGNVLYTINKDTEADENGNIRIDYQDNNLNRIQIKTTKPVQEGSLSIYNIKSMKPDTGYSRRDLEKFNKFEETIKANDITKVLTMNLLDTAPKADIQLNKAELSTMQENQEMEIKVILNVTDETMELYNNPLLQITFPDEVEQISLQDNINLLYEQELQIANSWVDGKTVYIELQGEQTSYKETALQGAEINFKVNLTLNKKATNSDREIKLNVTNRGNGKVVEASKTIKIISPRDMITINSINEIGVETYGQEENSEITLNRNNDKKQVQVSSEIINNKENVQNVRILGDMPTNNSKNNLNAIVTSPISIEGKEARVYYTANENADDNLENAENGWTDNFENVNEPKKYLLIADNMNVSDTIKTSYTVQIPESLEYEQQATEGYTVMFTDAETASNNVKATDVTLTTGQGPKLEGNLTASVGKDSISNGSTVKVGEVIYYNLEIKNTGSETANNVTVNVPVPEGMQLLEEKPAVAEGESNYEEPDDPNNMGYIYGNGFYNEINSDTYKSTIEKMEPGETANVEFLLRADAQNANVSITPEVNYNEGTMEVNGLNLNIEDNAIQVYIKSVDEPAVVHQEGLRITYIVGVKNISDTVQNNVKIDIDHPDSIELSSISFQESDYEGEQVTIDSIEPGEEKTIKYIYDIVSVNEEEEQILTSVNVTDSQGNITRANVFPITAYGISVDINLTANNENGYVKTDDEIEYKLTVKNNGKVEINSLFIEDQISNELTILSALFNGEEVSNEDILENRISVSSDLEVGASIELDIKTVVNYSDTRTENVDIVNQAEMEINTKSYTSNEVRHTIEASRTDIVNPDDPDNPGGGSDEDGYSIRGIAWLDENEDGAMQSDEEKISNISVSLLDIETNDFAKDGDGKVITTTTNNSGEYTLRNLKPGQYMVIFDYDLNKYSLTTYQKEGVNDSENSDVISRELSIDGMPKIYAVTDTIEITDRSVANISIGLVKAKEFDLKLDKYVTQVVVQSPSGTKVHSFNNSSLARVELEAKQMNSSSVVIEYAIVVTNVGEVDAYARDIMDKLPEGFEFSSELNKDWYLMGNEAHNASIANDVISPNESKTLTLVLTKDMTNDTAGTYTNTAQIVDSYNASGVQDINDSNNVSQAQTILGIRTGSIILNIALVITCIVTVGVGIYFIKKKVLN